MKTRSATARPAAAFTLLEITIALAVFAFVMISVIGCWKSIVSGKMIAENAAAAAQRARIGMKTVVEALTCGEISALNLQFYGFLNDTSSKFATLSVAARLPADFPGSGMFGDNVMRRVTFDVERDADGKDNLIMNQSPLLAILDEVNTPYSITLARDVNVFMLEFWSARDGEWVVAWEPTNAFPPMIRVTLGCGHSSEHPDVPYNLICRTVAMPSSAH